MTPTSFSSTVSRYGKYLVGIIWLISTLMYLNIHGVVTTQEAGKYIDEARHYITTGSFSAPRFYFYCVTLFILIFAIKINIGMVGAFIIQALLNLFAYIFFYKALTTLFKSAFTPLIIILYLLTFSPYQSWVVFLYTESAFFSATLLLISVLILYKPVNPRNLALITAAFLFTIISRPLGILFGAGMYLYIFYNSAKLSKIAVACGSIIMAACGYYLINTVFSSTKDWHITQAFEQESIICDLPSAGPYEKLDLASTGSPIYQLWYYASHNFSHFAHFAGTKLRYFFFMTRPYYSAAHNYYLLLNIIPVYALAFGGLFTRKTPDGSVLLFILGSIAAFALAIVFQCDDYHNRFILPIYPFMVILAAGAAEHLFYTLLKTANRLPVSV